MSASNVARRARSCLVREREREREKRREERERERRQMREQRGTVETLTQLYIWNPNNGLSRLLWASVLLEAVVIYCSPPKIHLRRRLL